MGHDRVATVVAVVMAAVAALLFLLPAATGGWVAPLDDAYIHLQYAWNLGRGHPLRYHPGDPATTGATSPLWVALLAIGAAVRLSREALVALAQLTGAALLAATLVTVVRLAGAAGLRRGALLAVAAVAGQGFLLWLFFSGMETGLYLLVVCAALMGFARWTDGAPPRSLVVAAALAPLARPDGVAIAAIAAALILARGAGRRRAAAVETIAVLAPFALYLSTVWAATGTATTAGLAMKAVTHHPSYGAREALAAFGANVAGAVRGLLLGGQPGYLGAERLVGGLAGWLAAAAVEARRRRAGVACVAVALIVAALLSGALVGVKQWRMERYQAPTLLLVALGNVWLVAMAAAAARSARGVARVAALLVAAGAAVAVLLPAPWSVAGWRAELLRETAVTRALRIAAAEQLRRLPADARVVVCDAGVLAYLGGRWTYDVVGLTTRTAGNSYLSGPGGRFEELERWMRTQPRERWPDHAAVFPWCLWDGLELRELWTRDGLTISTFREPGALTGDGPRLPHGGRLVDALDIADLGSEQAHRFRESERFGRPAVERNVVGRGRIAGRIIADGGRRIAGEARFRMRHDAGKRAVLVLRTLGASALRSTVGIEVNGDVIDWVVPAGDEGEFFEGEIELGVREEGELEIRVQVAEAEPLGLYHAWVYAR